MSGLWLLYAAFGLNVASFAPLVSVIESDLEIKHSAMGVLLGAWQFTYVCVAIPCGILLDRFNLRVLISFGALLVAISAFGRSFAENYNELLIMVMLFGVGGSFISIGSPKLIAEWFQGKSRGIAMGIYITGPGIGAIIALVSSNSILTGEIIDGWRDVFWVWGLASTFSLVMWSIVALCTRYNKLSIQDSGTLTLGVLMGLLKRRAIQIVLCMGMGTFFFTHGLSNWLPELIRTHGIDQEHAGYWAAIPVAIAIGGALIIPRFATPSWRYKILVGLFLSVSASSIFLQFESGVTMTVALILDGVARSSMTAILLLVLLEIPGIGSKRSGTAGGIFFSMAELGGIGGPALLGLLYELTGNFSAGLGVLTIVTLLLVFSVRLLKNNVASG